MYMSYMYIVTNEEMLLTKYEKGFPAIKVVFGTALQNVKQRV